MVKSEKRTFRVLLGAGSLLLFLAAGNLFFASVKLSNYQVLLGKATEEMTLQPPSAPFVPSEMKLQSARAPNLDRQSRHIERLRGRMEFYRFVMLGGKLLLGTAAIVFLAAVLVGGARRGQADEEETDAG